MLLSQETTKDSLYGLCCSDSAVVTARRVGTPVGLDSACCIVGELQGFPGVKAT